MSLEPALGLVELSSIARGVVVADAMAKKAPVRLLQNHPISPGKHVIVVGGGVAEVDEAMLEAVAVAGALIVDRLFLPQAHDQLPPLVAGRAASGQVAEAVAIVETFTVASTILAADAAAKAAGVTLLEMRLGQGIGGKGYFTMTGSLDEVEASTSAARAAIDAALIVGTELIPSPHADLRGKLIF